MQKESGLMGKIICLIFVVIFILSGLGLLTDKCEAKTKSKNKSVANTRKVTSLHKAFIGHWKAQGADGNWVDYFVTKSTINQGNMLEGTYSVYAEDIDRQTLFIIETTNIVGANIPRITDNTAITFSADYKSATLISNPNGKIEGGIYYGPEKHYLKYIGQK